jgi:hypothetical protein
MARPVFCASIQLLCVWLLLFSENFRRFVLVCGPDRIPKGAPWGSAYLGLSTFEANGVFPIQASSFFAHI